MLESNMIFRILFEERVEYIHIKYVLLTHNKNSSWTNFDSVCLFARLARQEDCAHLRESVIGTT